MTTENKELEVREAVDQQELVKKVYHTDARVTAMEGELRQLASGVSRIETLLLNKQEVSPLAWFGVIFSVLTLVGGLVWGMSQYVELTLDPVRAELLEHNMAIRTLKEFQHQTHYEFGRIHEWKDSQHSEPSP